MSLADNMMTMRHINMFHHQYPKGTEIIAITQSGNGILVEYNGIWGAAVWDGQYWQEYDIDESEPKKILRRVDNTTPIAKIEEPELSQLYDKLNS